MADDHAEVPQRMEELAQELLFVGTDAAAEQHEQIDVRLQTEMPPAIAAEREHRDVRVRRRDVGEQLPQHRIDAIGVALERGAAARTAQRIRLELGSGGVECRHEGGRAGARLCK